MKMAILTAAALLVLGTGPALAADGGGTLGDILGDVATHAVDRAAQDTVNSALPPPSRVDDRGGDDNHYRHDRGDRHDDGYRGEDHRDDRGRSYDHRRDGRGRDGNPGRGRGHDRGDD